jgi:hypothetical protein
MNVFVLDKDPIRAAQLQCDKHVVKMVTESAQMLSTVHRLLDGKMVLKPSKSGKRMVKYYDLYEGSDDLEMEMILMKNVHEKHPCTIWSMESSENYNWHWIHLKALCEEYTYRYGKIHKVERVHLWPLKNLPRNIPIGKMTEFPLAMKSNPECMFPDDPVKSYRKFYKTKQERFKMIWTKRPTPEWFNANV